MREPEDREQLITLLHSAHERDLLDAEALAMIEGVLQTSELSASDIMVPRGRMDVIDIATPADEFLPRVVRSGHSRFPVIDGNLDDVIGILLAKDLLRVYAGQELRIREILRPAVFVPESKRLNDLLRQFRANRNHIAIIVNEYGGVAGLVTIEDVLEQIVGEIDDEYDLDDTADNIHAEGAAAWRVQARTELADFNRYFGCTLADADADTIGGLVINRMGRIPKRGESITTGDLRIQVLRTDSRQVHLLRVLRMPGTA